MGKKNAGLIDQSAENAVSQVLARYKIDEEFLLENSQISEDDLFNAAQQRLNELTGHPRREYDNWRKMVAYNAAHGVIKVLMKKHTSQKD